MRLAYDNPVPAPCAVVRTAVHAHVPPFPLDSPYAHDWQQWYLLTYHGDFARIERPVMKSRVHGNNLSVGAAAALASHQSVAKDYADLLARPEVTPDDAKHLRAGLARKRVLGATMAQLPAAMMQHGAQAMAWSALAEGLSARLARVTANVASRTKARGLNKSVGAPYDLSAIARSPNDDD